MFAREVAKMDILISDELNQCMACDYTSHGDRDWETSSSSFISIK